MKKWREMLQRHRKRERERSARRSVTVSLVDEMFDVHRSTVVIRLVQEIASFLCTLGQRSFWGCSRRWRIRGDRHDDSLCSEKNKVWMRQQSVL